ncbi:MAG: acyl-CoA dehydrogenase [Acidimicrobiia bacterium]
MALGAWLDAQEPLCAMQRDVHHLELTELAVVQRDLQRALFDAGWVRYGWPESVGGLGGDARHRATMYDELTRRGVPVPETYLTLETLIPMLVHFAPSAAPGFVPPLLRGDEAWCQGFSEPDAGSDLASLRTRAVRDGDEWVLDGQKVWTSQATIAQRCVALARTGTPESRHKGLSMFLVDHDTPGVTVRPIRAMTGRDEFGEVFFDGARVPADRLIGEEGAGWAVAMYLLQWERGMYPWQRQGWLHVLVDSLIEHAGATADPGEIADAYLAVTAMRLKARQTIRRLAAGENPGPEISVDKVLLALGDQAVTDVAERVLSPVLELDDDGAAEGWRQEYLFGRAAPIYGGSIEIQRSILADRVLGLPRG